MRLFAETSTEAKFVAIRCCVEFHSREISVSLSFRHVISISKAYTSCSTSYSGCLAAPSLALASVLVSQHYGKTIVINEHQ